MKERVVAVGIVLLVLGVAAFAGSYLLPRDSRARQRANMVTIALVYVGLVFTFSGATL